MKSKKLLSLFLASIMCLSIFTGCGKNKEETTQNEVEEVISEDYHEAFVKLVDEIGEIKEGEMELTLDMTVSKDALETAQESLTETEITGNLSLEAVNTDEILEKFYDKDGNFNFEIELDAEFDIDKEQYLIDVHMIDSNFDVYLDEDTVYLNIENFIDLLGNLTEEDMSNLDSLLSGYKYLKIETENTEIENSEIEEENKKSIKDFITKDTVTKKNNKYIATLGNDCINELITNEEVLETLDIDKFENSSLEFAVEKEDEEYMLKMSLNLENILMIECFIVIADESVDIDMPTDSTIDAETLVTLFLGGIGGYEDNNYDNNVYEDEDTDYWDETNTVEDMIIKEKFNVDKGSLSFIIEPKSYTVNEIANVCSDITYKVKTIFEDVYKDKLISSSTNGSTGDYSYSSSSLSVSQDDYTEEISIYVGEDSTSLNLSYTDLYIDNIYDNIEEIVYKIKTFIGIDIPKETLKAYIDKLIASYDNVDDMIVIRSDYDIYDYDLSIYLWDGEEIDIDIYMYQYNE